MMDFMPGQTNSSAGIDPRNPAGMPLVHVEYCHFMEKPKTGYQSFLFYFVLLFYLFI